MSHLYKAPLRSIPYLARESFNALGASLFISVLIILLALFYISGEVEQPAWIGTSVKATAILIIIIDVVLRCLSLKIEIKNNTLSYYCRGIFNLKKSKFPLSDISNIDIDKKLHYRLLSLTAINLYGVGSSDSLIGKVVLSHADADEIRKLLSITSGEKDKKEEYPEEVRISYRWAFLTALLMPWRRVFSKVNYVVFTTLLIFISTMFSTGGDIEKSTSQLYSKHNINAEETAGAIPKIEKMDILGNIHYYEAISLSLFFNGLAILVFGPFNYSLVE